MTKEQAQEKAMNCVFLHMTLGDIEDNCKKRGIRVVKNRATMEHKLIEAMVEELIEK